MAGSAKPKWERAKGARGSERVSLLRESTALELRLPANRQALSPAEVALAFVAALEAIGAPAFVVTANVEVMQASASGKALFESDSADLTRTLFDVVRGRSSSRSVSVTPLDAQRSLFLAVLREPCGDARVTEQVLAAKTRWRLTARQQEVLHLAARGLTNQTIAEMLGIGASTVEYHLRSIFDKAGVDNRATLVARVLEL